MKPLGLLFALAVGAGCDLQSPTLTTAAWQVELGTSYTNASNANPATDGVRFFATYRSGIDAFDVRTGARVWRATGLGGAELAIALVAQGGRVIAAGDRVASLDGSSGAVRWSF